MIFYYKTKQGIIQLHFFLRLEESRLVELNPKALSNKSTKNFKLGKTDSKLEKTDHKFLDIKALFRKYERNETF